MVQETDRLWSDASRQNCPPRQRRQHGLIPQQNMKDSSASKMAGFLECCFLLGYMWPQQSQDRRKWYTSSLWYHQQAEVWEAIRGRCRLGYSFIQSAQSKYSLLNGELSFGFSALPIAPERVMVAGACELYFSLFTGRGDIVADQVFKPSYIERQRQEGCQSWI